jgi:hypothetical protein
LVVAETLSQALDAATALSADAPVVWDEAPDNVLVGHKVWRQRGNRPGNFSPPTILSKWIRKSVG